MSDPDSIGAVRAAGPGSPAGVTGYRRSYWKTLTASAFLSTGGVVLLALLIAWAWLAVRPWGPVGWLAWTVALVVVGAAAGWAGLVAAGGIIGLRRDTLEARGVPYVRHEPREWLPSPAVAALLRSARAVRRTLGAGGDALALRPGELVEVKSLEEILATLDDEGALDGLPFMPEMSAWCGKQARVFRRVDKLIDWVGRSGLRRLRDTVLLQGIRCGGEHHGGCQAQCAVRWKEAWLRRPTDAATHARRRAAAARPVAGPPLDADRLMTLAGRVDEAGERRYVCQVTRLAAGTTPLARTDPRHYLRDLVRGNVRLRPLLVGVSIAMFNWVQRRRRGVRFPNYAVTAQKTTPHEVLDLHPGELVRVRTKREIEPTLNARSRNRGLWFDAEMLRYCGADYRVLSRVERLIDETTGKLVHLSNPCIILDGVRASGEYLAFCAQNESIFWREIWLRRVAL